MDRLSLGCDIGNSTIKMVLLDHNYKLLAKDISAHEGDVVKVFNSMKQKMLKFSHNSGRVISHSMVCGSFASDVDAVYWANHTKMLVEGVKLLQPECSSIIEIGGESSCYISGIQKSDIRFSMNSSCAAGTGSFFIDQMTRLGLRIEDFNSCIDNAVTIPRIAGRCTVFAKTDIIHRQQEGVPVSDILKGLCFALVKNYKAAVIRDLPVKNPIIFSGGVSKNKGVVQAFKEILKSDEIQGGEYSEFYQATGCALEALKNNTLFNEEKFLLKPDTTCYNVLPPLKNKIDTSKLHHLHPFPENGSVYLGIDIGSTSTNHVLLDSRGRVVDFLYLRTGGDSLETAKEGIRIFKKRYCEKLNITAIGTTGSGRYRVGNKLNADLILDEITTQARGALESVSDCDTIFEIGGQDSKYICIRNGLVRDFQMNKVCAAGTGSFIEEQAKRLNLSLDEFGEVALSSETPAELGEQCTVFIKSKLEQALTRGANKNDVSAGLCYSIVHNYLHKVVGNKPVGTKICLSGGVAWNPALLAAFKHYYPEIQVTPYFSVTGAYGTALLVREAHLKTSPIKNKLHKSDKESLQLFAESDTAFTSGYTGIQCKGKKTIGIPRALMIYKLFPMAYGFFEKLGFNVLLSPESNEDIISRSQDGAKEETCYPVKLMIGHISWLIEQGVDALFIPSVYTMKHESSHLEHNYGCVFMQGAAKQISGLMELEKKGIQLLNPVLKMDLGKPALAGAMIETGITLGKPRTLCALALTCGAKRFKKFIDVCENAGTRLLNKCAPKDKVLVIVTRAYGIDDAVLSMGIIAKLLERGFKVITLSHLKAHDIPVRDGYPNMYWPFGQHIIAGMHIIKNDPRLYAVYLTNHGCGPDSMLSHQVAGIMKEKPYLEVEVDEHYSQVGLITRIEAFLSALDSHKQSIITEDIKGHTTIKIPSISNRFNMPKTFRTLVGKEKSPLYIPYIFPYSSLLCHLLNSEFSVGNTTNRKPCFIELPPTDEKSMILGRSKMRGKEYCSFTSLCGDILKCEKNESNPHRILILQNKGTETDGQFSRTIRCMLDKMNREDIVIESPAVEELWDDPLLWQTLVWGDLIMTAAPENRSEILNSILSIITEKGKLQDSDLFITAKRIVHLWEQETARPRASKSSILISGDPRCVFNPQLSNGLLQKLEGKRKIHWMPLSEYFHFLWKEIGTIEKRNKRLSKILQHREQLILQLSKVLKYHSPYSVSMESLRISADKGVGEVNASNIRYRTAKTKVKKDSTPYAAVIDTVPLYENAGTLSSLSASSRHETDIPLIRLNLNGTDKESDKLETFMHFQGL